MTETLFYYFRTIASRDQNLRLPGDAYWFDFLVVNTISGTVVDVLSKNSTNLSFLAIKSNSISRISLRLNKLNTHF